MLIYLLSIIVISFVWACVDCDIEKIVRERVWGIDKKKWKGSVPFLQARRFGSFAATILVLLSLLPISSSPLLSIYST